MNSLATANRSGNNMAIFFVLAAEISCTWTFATQLASNCECDGLVYSASDKAVLQVCSGSGKDLFGRNLALRHGHSEVSGEEQRDQRNSRRL